MAFFTPASRRRHGVNAGRALHSKTVLCSGVKGQIGKYWPVWSTVGIGETGQSMSMSEGNGDNGALSREILAALDQPAKKGGKASRKRNVAEDAADSSGPRKGTLPFFCFNLLLTN